ncbi:MAG TPA: hypothetical protein VJ307_02990 [Candidatus Deferrimicrobiaceae bacterium]|jgi:hypothetical protein|nr:hypothetical protein [Candidatus Deferrimicrobiaceae bacterium]
MVRAYLGSKGNSIRSRPGRIEPKVYFRIDHIAREDHNFPPVAAYREQTVVIVLGPKGAFENSNIGGLAESDPRRIRQRMPGT